MHDNSMRPQVSSWTWGPTHNFVLENHRQCIYAHYAFLYIYTVKIQNCLDLYEDTEIVNKNLTGLGKSVLEQYNDDSHDCSNLQVM